MMEKKDRLSQMAPGERGKVSGLFAEGAFRRRLQDAGFCPGEEVVCLMKSPLGDPTAFSVRECVIALRNQDAALVAVEAEYPQ